MRFLKADVKGRVNLGINYANFQFVVDEDEGIVTLKAAVVIPKEELWLYQNPEAWCSVQEGLKAAREGRLIKDAVDIDALEAD